MAGGAFAQFKPKDILQGFDEGPASLRWESGNVEIRLDGTPASFLDDLNDDWNTDVYPNACSAGGGTQFAGQGLIALYHTDNAPAGAPGFQSTSQWQLVKCSALDQQGGQAVDKKQPSTSDLLYTCDPTPPVAGQISRCEIVTQDIVDPAGCSTGNCLNEIVTTFNINLDTDCNGVKDTGFDTDVCLYWEAQKPSAQPAGQSWNGNIQVRINGGGSGDKTANFSLTGPNAVTLSDLKASGLARLPAVAVVAGLLILGVAATVYRRGLRRA